MLLPPLASRVPTNLTVSDPFMKRLSPTMLSNITSASHSNLEREIDNQVGIQMLRFEREALLSATYGSTYVKFRVPSDLLIATRLRARLHYANFDFGIICGEIDFYALQLQKIKLSKIYEELPNPAKYTLIEPTVLEMIDWIDLMETLGVNDANKNVYFAQEKFVEWESVFLQKYSLGIDLAVLSELREILKIMASIALGPRKFWNIDWRNQDWRCGGNELLINPHSLNWISSSAGQGFLENLKSIFVEAAKGGRNGVELKFSQLKKNHQLNTESLYTASCGEDNNQIGALPFTPDVIDKVIKLLGFKCVIIPTEIGQSLKVSWC